ncbi:MAG: hypothetical protein M3R44_07070 [Candidatus Eremiobacteraeota bacterium]|nr:hypothetical protein [Candidatus Eremiobacteraeota bacterium]
MSRPQRFRFLALALPLTLAACGGGSGGGSSLALPAPHEPINETTPLGSAGVIKHVVILVQENRSFDNLFEGFPGANTASSGTASNGSQVALVPRTLEDGHDLGHFHYSFETEYDGGKLDGFDQVKEFGIVNGLYNPLPNSDPHYSFAYVPQTETQPYWQLAQQYALGDETFQSNSGPSFPAHQYLIAGQSDDADEVPQNMPWGCDAPAGSRVPQLTPSGTDSPGVFPCFDYTTLADSMDAAGVTWRYYTPQLTTRSGGQFSAYDAIRHIRYGPDWTTDEVNPETQIFSDLTSGTLPQVSWVIPSFENSDHPLAASNTGPSWVTSVVNAIGASPYWDSTAVFVTWDDWGGWYDNVRPPQVDLMGLGFRVPLVVVSPYSKHGYVSHAQHEFGSILRFTEETFGLKPLGTRDIFSDDLRDCFDFSQTPPAYRTISTRYRKDFFMHQVHSGRPPDLV